MEAAIQDYFNGLCCPDAPVLPYNFDVESSDWAGVGITDKASFESALGVTVGDFAITGNKIEAEILTTTTNGLGLNSKNITNVNYITISGLQSLSIKVNSITSFNPTLPLPSGLLELNISSNQLTNFNPTVLLPITLENLNLTSNLIDNAGYTISETWANSQPAFTNTCLINFTGNPDSVSGTNLETILLTKNTTVNA